MTKRQWSKISAETSTLETTQTGSSSCDCSGNLYNCDDFKTQAEAQACFENCGGVGNKVCWPINLSREDFWSLPTVKRLVYD